MVTVKYNDEFEQFNEQIQKMFKGRISIVSDEDNNVLFVNEIVENRIIGAYTIEDLMSWVTMVIVNNENKSLDVLIGHNMNDNGPYVLDGFELESFATMVGVFMDAEMPGSYVFEANLIREYDNYFVNHWSLGMDFIVFTMNDVYGNVSHINPDNLPLSTPQIVLNN